MNTKDLARKIVDIVGNEANVNFVQHCATRLRFTLKNEDQVDLEVLKQLDGVAGTVYKGGQLQLIIGPDVAYLYDEVIKLMPNKKGGEVDDNGNAVQEVEKEKLTFKKAGSNVLSAISGCIIPLIPIIVSASLIKMLATVLGPSMLNVITTDNNLYTLLSFAGDAGFYFLPIYIGYTAAKYFKVTPVMGMFMAAIMLHPTLVGLVSSGVQFDVYGIPMTMVNYASSTLPIILIVWIMSYVEKTFNKFVPTAIKMVFVPLLTMLVMLPIALCIVGPLGTLMGNAFTNMMFGIASFGVVGRILVAGLSGGLWNVLVLCGMHLTYYIAGLQLFFANGFDSLIMPGTVSATVAVAGMTVGALLRLKDKENRGLTLGYLISHVIGGVTEPSIFGIGIKYKKPFFFACVGGFAGAIYYAVMNTGVYTMAASANFMCFAGFLGSTSANMINGFIGGAIAFVVAAGLTYSFGFPKEDTK